MFSYVRDLLVAAVWMLVVDDSLLKTVPNEISAQNTKGCITVATCALVSLGFFFAAGF